MTTSKNDRDGAIPQRTPPPPSTATEKGEPHKYFTICEDPFQGVARTTPKGMTNVLTVKQEWEEFISSMHTGAIQRFHQTSQFSLLNEKVEQMQSDCKINFMGADYEYLEAWLEAVAHLDSEESVYVYKQGYRDCMALLKLLAVIE